MKPTALPLRPLITLFVGVGLAAAPHLQRLPLWISGMVVVLLGWRVWGAWRQLVLPRKWLLYTLAVCGTLGVWITYHTLFGRDAGVTLLVLLVALKLLEMRTLRDVVIVTFLCYFLALTHFFYSQTMPTAALMFATAFVLTIALLGMHAPARPFAGTAASAATLMMQGVPIMLALFFLFPRVQGPLWGMPADAYSGMTGLSDSMTPGNISSLSQSDAIAFRVDFEGEPPERKFLYWRGPVFWEFDGRTWRAGAGRAPGEIQFAARSAPVKYQVTLEPHNRPWLFALDLPAEVPPRAAATDDFQLLAREPVRTRRRYDMSSFLVYSMDGGPSEGGLAAALQLPEGGNPRAVALAERWRAGGASTQAVLARAIEFFRTSRLQYSLAPPLLGRDSVDEFLFDTREGFCEHFSSAFAVLMRAAGIPARIVTGYQGGERNPVDGSFVVRQLDAHAWVEVSLENRGWVRIDPTALAVPMRVDIGLSGAVIAESELPLLARPDFAWLRALRFNWEAANNYWNQWVLGFDPERQREMLTRMGMRSPDWRQMSTLLFWILGILILVVAATMLRRTRLADPAQAAWSVFCRKLARRGTARAPGEGPADFAVRAAQAHPAYAAEVAAIGALYLELRYGPSPGAHLLAQLRRRVRAFRA